MKNKFTINTIFIFCCSLILTFEGFFSQKAMAQSNDSSIDLKEEMSQDEELAQRVRNKQFPGGKDEGELVVLPELPTPKRKFKDEKEATEEPEAAAD